MISIKINCSCGQKFRFNVVPVNGRMPAPVSCPACGADATEAANQQLTLQIAPSPAQNPYRTPLLILSIVALLSCVGLGALLVFRSPEPEPKEPTPPPTPAAPAPKPVMRPGIGIHVAKDKPSGKYAIIRVFADSPAAKAKLAPGILVNKINGVTIAEKDLDKVAQLIRGPLGSKATLELINPTEPDKPFTVEITRQLIQMAK